MKVRFLTGALLAIVAIVCALGAATTATAEPIAPYDGANPFKCKLQKLGTGTEYKKPNADPLCVEFDKTNQNVTELGVVDFLLNEPARVAAAVPKCFYYQLDHWTGTIEQGGQPVLWHWDGMYFFDKAKGLGGAHVENLTIGGMPADPSLLPGFPTEFSPYFGAAEGGAYATLGAGTPECIAKVDTTAEARNVYRRQPR
jgi:hypothetical protein